MTVALVAPDCKVEERTREEALSRRKMALEDWLAETEVVTIEVNPPEPTDPSLWELGKD